MSVEIESTVTLSLVGEAKGTKEGGVLQQSLYEVTVQGLPQDIPSSIDVDVTELGVNDVLTLQDVKVDGKIEITQSLEEPVASVLPPQQEELPDSGEQQGDEENQEVEATEQKDKE